MALEHLLARTQGIYFVLTGIWPLLHIKSFILVTGPKTDIWLVKTVGALVTASGFVLLFSSWRNEITLTVALLAFGQALALLMIDLIYSVKKIISKIYLVDAALQVAFVGFWLLFSLAN
jgi:hypothetical protein